MMATLLSVAWPPVEDRLVVVDWYRVALLVHVGACLQADTVWAQAARMVQVLGHPVQVPVQPVGRELMSSGGTGGLEKLEGEKGVAVDLAS